MTTTGELIDSGLDPVDLALIAALAGGASTTQAATAACVSVTTAYRRATSPAFRAALAEAKAGRWQPSADLLRDEVLNSIKRLVALRDSETASPTIQLRASESIVTLALKLDEL